MKLTREHILLFISTKFLGRYYLLVTCATIVLLIFAHYIFMGHINRQEQVVRLGTLIPQEYLLFEKCQNLVRDIVSEAKQKDPDDEVVTAYKTKLQDVFSLLVITSLKVEGVIQEGGIRIEDLHSYDVKRKDILLQFELYVQNVLGANTVSLSLNGTRILAESEQLEQLSSIYTSAMQTSVDSMMDSVRDMRWEQRFFFLALTLVLIFKAMFLFWPMLRRLQKEFDRNLVSKKYYKKQAYYDEVAQVGNRKYILAVLQERISSNNKEFVCAFIDFDNFKPINDTYGHDMGDWCLRSFGEVVKKRTRRYDYIGRVGGDEFVIVFDTSSLKGIEELLNKVRREFIALGAEKFADIPLSFSYGLSQFPQDGASGDALLRIADSKMYESKMKRKDSEGSDQVPLETEKEDSSVS